MEAVAVNPELDAGSDEPSSRQPEVVEGSRGDVATLSPMVRTMVAVRRKRRLKRSAWTNRLPRKVWYGA